MNSDKNKNITSKNINNSTDRATVKQYLEINFSKAQMSYGVVTYEKRKRINKINVADLLWELNANGVMASYKLLKSILTPNK